MGPGRQNKKECGTVLNNKKKERKRGGKKTRYREIPKKQNREERVWQKGSGPAITD